MGDALVVERMKGEKSDRKGGIQSTCWMLRFRAASLDFCSVVVHGSVLLSAYLFLQGLVPLTMLPPLYMLEDPVVDAKGGRRGGGRSRGSISSRQERGSAWA